MPARLRGVQPLGPGGWRPIFRVMCGRVRLSSDVSEIKFRTDAAGSPKSYALMRIVVSSNSSTHPSVGVTTNFPVA